MPDTVHLNMITAGELTTMLVLPQILTALEQHAPTIPTHWGTDERARTLYDRDQVLATITDRSTFAFHRRKPPRYEGDLTVKRHNLNYLAMDYRSGIEDPQVPAVFALGAELADQLHPAFGFVHSIWKLGERSQSYSAVAATNVHRLQTYGPRAPCTRTWFGPHLVDLIGRDALHACAGVTTDLTWGGVMLDLVEQPWTADFETLAQRQTQIVQELTPTGVFGDYSQRLDYRPGPRWVPVPLD